MQAKTSREEREQKYSKAKCDFHNIAYVRAKWTSWTRKDHQWVHPSWIIMAEQAKTTLKYRSCVLFTTNSVYPGVAKTHCLFIMKRFSLARFPITILLHIYLYAPAVTTWQKSTSLHNPFTVCAHYTYSIFISYKEDKQASRRIKKILFCPSITFLDLLSILSLVATSW